MHLAWQYTKQWTRTNNPCAFHYSSSESVSISSSCILVCLFQQSSAPSQWQNILHYMPELLQPHLHELHSFSPLHEHLVTLRRASGACGVFGGSMTGLSEPSSMYHPWSNGSNAGGWGSKAFFQIANWMRAPATFYKRASLVGGKDCSLGDISAHLIHPESESSFSGWIHILHTIAC